MTKPRLLDLFCGAGGASMGYHRAGFEVVGVDIKPQKHYPFEFHQADAMTYPLDGFDVIHASPPCQAYSAALNTAPERRQNHPDLVASTRDCLNRGGRLYVIENVVGAPLQNFFMLCGTMFGLQTPCGAELRRHRLFEVNWTHPLTSECSHYSPRTLAVAVIGGTALAGRRGRTITVTGAVAQMNVERNVKRETFSANYARIAMGIDWMNRDELSQAIPPAYTEFIGKQLMESLA